MDGWGVVVVFMHSLVGDSPASGSEVVLIVVVVAVVVSGAVAGAVAVGGGRAWV